MSAKTQTNAADATEVQGARDREKRRAMRERDDLKQILETKSGRRFIWRKLEECGVFRTSMTGNSTTFFNEGMRNVGLKLLAEVNEVRPQAYVEMLTEAKDDSF